MHANHPIHDRLPIVAPKPCLHHACCSRSRYDCLRTLKFFAENGFILSLSFYLPLSLSLYLFFLSDIPSNSSNFMRGSNATMEVSKCQSFRFSLDRSTGFVWIRFWPANRLRCFIVGTVLQIIANAASNCLTICSNKPSACHSFDDIFGRLT